MPVRALPYVICHMMPSVDGRIVTAPWKLPRKLYAEYERTALTFWADAWLIGRVSMEPYAGRATLPRQKAPPLPRADFTAPHVARSYAIALDPSGKLRWRSNQIDGEHVITVLTEKVSDAYLHFLQSKGVSYLFGGRDQLNLERVLRKLRKTFGIKKLLLEGGGKINGSFLAEDLVDELSVLVAPVADGSIGSPTLFDANAAPVARRLKLKSVRKRAGDLVWLRYAIRR